MSADLDRMLNVSRILLEKRGFVPSQPAMIAGGMPPGADPSMGGAPAGAPPGMPPGVDPSAGGGGMPPGAPMGGDPSMAMPPDAAGAPGGGLPPTAPDGSVPASQVPPEGSGGGKGGAKLDPGIIMQMLQSNTQVLSEVRLLRELILDMMKSMGHAISPDSLRTGMAGADAIVAAPTEAKMAAAVPAEKPAAEILPGQEAQLARNVYDILSQELGLGGMLALSRLTS